MSDTPNRIRLAYDEWAEIYDHNENPTRDLNYATIREAPLELSGKEVLEIGCGTGLNTAYLVRQAKKVTAVDFSEEMLAKARRRLEGAAASFVTADITEPWAFEDETFDRVVANLVLEHVNDLTPVFEEAFRVLRPGGKYYLAELHPYKQLRQSQAKFNRPRSGEKVLVDAFTHSISEYVNGAQAAGFSLAEMGEHQREEEPIPRLLSLLFEKPV